MPSFRLHAAAVLASLALTGCASSFKSVDGSSLALASTPADTSGLKVEYRFNVLDDSHNPRYASKARAHGYQYVAVKVTNTQSRPLAMKTDVAYFLGENRAAPLPASTTAPVVRQRTGAYSLYLLLMLINAFKAETVCDDDGCEMETTFIPVGVILGPALAIGNMAVSSSANQNFAKEFIDKDLYERTLQPGETATGYLVFRGVAPAPLAIRPL